MVIRLCCLNFPPFRQRDRAYVKMKFKTNGNGCTHFSSLHRILHIARSVCTPLDIPITLVNSYVIAMSEISVSNSEFLVKGEIMVEVQCLF